MEFRRLAKVLGILVVIMGLLMLFVSGYAYLEYKFRFPTPANQSAFEALIGGAGITIVAGLGLAAIGWKAPNEFLRREALVIVGLSWILSAFFGALPYFFCNPGEAYRLDAAASLFESMSGLTTTGATILTDIEAFPKAILLWRALTQYIGGIGILVLFIAVLSFLGVGGRTMMAQETSLNISESRSSKIGETAWGLLKVYLVLSLVCFIGLLALGMPMFDSVCHTFTAISTAGFSPKNDSIHHYNHLGIEIWIAVFMLLGSVSFMFYLLIVKRNKDERDLRRIKGEEEARYYLIIVFVAIVLVSLNLMMNSERTFLQSVRECFFMVISLSSTTGFGTRDYDQWPVFSRIILWGLMVIGGCAGSTAGGLKMNRIILFARLTNQEMIQSFRPHQVFRIKLNGAAPDTKVLLQASMFIALAMVLFGFSVIIVGLIEPDLNFESVIGTVMGCLFNIGPGFGMVGPTDNYAFLNDGTKVFLSLLMVMGRLEFFAVLVLFVPALWKKY